MKWYAVLSPSANIGKLDSSNIQVSQMEIEIQGIPQSIRSQYEIRLRSAKAELARYKKLLQEQHAQLARVDLLSSSQKTLSTSDDPYGTNDGRAHMLAGTSLLEDGTRRLQQSQRVALETEDQGAEILMNLRSQREQIENARNTVCLTVIFRFDVLTLSLPSYMLRTPP